MAASVLRRPRQYDNKCSGFESFDLQDMLMLEVDGTSMIGEAWGLGVSSSLWFNKGARGRRGFGDRRQLATTSGKVWGARTRSPLASCAPVRAVVRARSPLGPQWWAFLDLATSMPESPPLTH
nr:hypothetical protein Itr_chr05CG08710 [Ipomoea trifida]